MAKWIENQMTIECPECGQEFSDEVMCCSIYGWPWSHCPNCGVEMDLPKEGTDT